MKTKTLALLAILALTSCGTGIGLTFDKEGIVITPPKEPIVIPNK